MKLRTTLLILVLIILGTSLANAHETEENEKKVKGLNIGFLPVVSYDSDLGFQYGALTNIYLYGNGETYPKYYHSIYAEVSQYTKGSGVYRLFYDSEYLIPNIRLTADILYNTEQAIDFYGFNGYQAIYNAEWTKTKDPDYKSRMYYKHKRNVFRFKADFRGRFLHDNLSWALGYNFIKMDIGSVDIKKLNSKKKGNDTLPDIPGLYDNYVDWGIISPKEAKGSTHHSIKVGLVYDSRDNEACPMKGIWTEAVLFNSFGKDFNFGKFALTHRQYFTLIKNDLSFAYRLGYQGVVWGDAPFYMLPYMVYSYMPSSSIDGLGGARSLRGVIRNRLVAKSVGFANIELRYKFWRFKFINQNWYLAGSPFLDMGHSISFVDIDKSGIPAEINQSQFFGNKESLHISYGFGLHIAMNENFIITGDIGFPAKSTDGKMGVYFGMNWLF